MPLSIDVILNNKVGPAFRRKIEESLQQGEVKGELRGRQEGRIEGRQEGEVAMLRRYLERRFGKLPLKYAKRLRCASEADLNAIADRAFTAARLEDEF